MQVEQAAVAEYTKLILPHALHYPILYPLQSVDFNRSFFALPSNHFIIRNALDLGDFTGQIVSGRWKSIFKSGVKSDIHRMQSKIKEKNVCEYPDILRVTEKLRTIIGELFPGYGLCFPYSLLKSTGGGGDQAPHSDYDEEAAKFRDYPPLGCVISITGGSFLNVEIGGRLVRSAELNRGDLLIFRGRHAGCGYNKLNIRLHYYLTHSSIPYEDYSQHTYL
jgi:hypothetical protein